jgi:hypothetical protein
MTRRTLVSCLSAAVLVLAVGVPADANPIVAAAPAGPALVDDPAAMVNTIVQTGVGNSRSTAR